jgi:hypothetical protein
MKAFLGYILIVVLAVSVAWVIFDRHTEVAAARTQLDTHYDEIIAQVNKAVAGPDTQATDDDRQTFVSYLKPKAVVGHGQTLNIKPHVVNGKPDPTYLFDVYSGETLIGTFNRATLEGYFYGKGKSHDIEVE